MHSYVSAHRSPLEEGSLEWMVRGDSALYAHPYKWTPEHLEKLEIPQSPFLLHNSEIINDIPVGQLSLSYGVRWDHVQALACGIPSSIRPSVRDDSMCQLMIMLLEAATGGNLLRYVDIVNDVIPWNQLISLL